MVLLMVFAVRLCRLAEPAPAGGGLTWRTAMAPPRSSKIALTFYLLFALVPFGWMLTASLEPQTSLYRDT